MSPATGEAPDSEVLNNKKKGIEQERSKQIWRVGGAPAVDVFQDKASALHQAANVNK